LRLLLETIPALPGELCHHLISPNYLAKRDGNHGDWLSRLDSERPAKTLTSHMSKDTYAYIHPHSPRSISVREAARIQSFPDWFSFGSLGMVDAFRVIGNAVPPLLSHQLAGRVVQILWATTPTHARPGVPMKSKSRSPKRVAHLVNDQPEDSAHPAFPLK